MLEVARAEGLELHGIVNTHGHWDHIADNADVRGLADVGIAVHEDDAPLLRSPRTGSLPCDVPPSEPDRLLADGDTVEVGRYRFDVLHTPEHSAGSICLYAADAGVLLAGDTLFAGSCGRCDLPGGDPAAFGDSLERLASARAPEAGFVRARRPAPSLQPPALARPVPRAKIGGGRRPDRRPAAVPSPGRPRQPTQPSPRVATMNDDASPHTRHGERVSPAHAGPEHAEPPEFTREVWGTRAGFILAAVGSAVGLGNMWRFPYVTAEGGGAAFVILYIGLVFVVGIPVMLGEFVLGRRTHQSPIGALKKAGGPAWAPLGYVFVLAGVLILSYYSVIAGWVARYALTGLFDGFAGDPSTFFELASTGSTAAWFHIGFMALTIGIVMGGIEKGIERASLLMMPVLFLLLIGLAVWAATLVGSGDGYAFYLAPDVGALFSLDTFAEAAGQTFFSLSLGMGAMLTFASYLSRQESLPREGTIIAFSDFGVAFTAGLLVFPIIFALGLQQQVSDSTVGALFIALPGAFVEMGTIGRVVGVFFFAALFIGAVTSAISLLEVVTSSLIDEWNVPRTSAAVGAGAVIALLGLWPASDLAALDALDQVAGNVLLVLGGFFLAIFVGWRMDDDAIEEVSLGTGPGLRPWLRRWLLLLRFVVPVLLAFVLSRKIPDAWDAVAALFG